MNLHIDSEDELPRIARAILESYPKERVFLLQGDMGSGKTTLIKRLCKELGVSTNMGSPTFALVNEYLSKDVGKIYHFDLYRIKSSRELAELGFSDYLDSGSYCFIEWPEYGQEFYDEFVNILINAEGKARDFRISKGGKK
jgi:tRNA threonylcarbamoyladenosine biosynthesis protein TsaE